MDAIKRASYASRQIRAGPAPLASFEDLPSDELESPEEIPLYKSSALEDESGGLTTPDSLTVSSQSTPRVELDFTLTPADSSDQKTPSELRTISLSSLNCKPKRGSSAISLQTIDTGEPLEYTQRKSSWTDIFRSHNHDSNADKTLKKKHRNDIPKKDQMPENKTKEKGKFLSIFKKKSNKSLATSPDDFIISNEEPEPEMTIKLTNGNVSKGKENELPDKIEFCPQNDLGKINSDKKDKIPDERKINRKLINICETYGEKEYNICLKPEQAELDKISKTENIQAIVHNVDNESSESELGFDEKEETAPEKKEDDYEAETLLTPDVSELDEDQVIELKPVSVEMSKQIVIPSRQQRLEVTTKPIDRPRSTTPINTASLEAFIRSVSPTFQSNKEKIKLSLPGEQFLGRVRSPKKSCAKSWSDFCEKGLSPRMYKRTDAVESEDYFCCPFEGANFSNEKVFSDSNWAAFESDFSSSDLPNRFSDNFSSVQNVDPNEQISADPHQPFETNFSSCFCECHKLTSNDNFSENCIITEVDIKNCSCDCQQERDKFDFDGHVISTDNSRNCDANNSAVLN